MKKFFSLVETNVEKQHPTNANDVEVAKVNGDTTVKLGAIIGSVATVSILAYLGTRCFLADRGHKQTTTTTVVKEDGKATVEVKNTIDPAGSGKNAA